MTIETRKTRARGRSLSPTSCGICVVVAVVVIAAIITPVLYQKVSGKRIRYASHGNASPESDQVDASRDARAIIGSIDPPAVAMPSPWPSMSPASTKPRDIDATISGPPLPQYSEETGWSIRAGERAFALNASSLSTTRRMFRSKHQCVNKDWGYDQIQQWSKDEGAVLCKPDGGTSGGATLRKHCATFPLQGGKRCFHTVSFGSPYAYVHRKNGLVKVGDNWNKPRWLLPCQLSHGSSLSTPNEALTKVFHHVEDGSMQTLVASGTVFRPQASTFTEEMRKGTVSKVDWLRSGPAPSDEVGSADASVGDLEGDPGEFKVWPTQTQAEKGFVYYIVNRDCGPPRYNPFHCTADVFNAVMILSALQLAPAEVVVLFTDSRGHGPYEHLWRTVGGAGVYTSARLAAIPADVRPPMRKAVVAPSPDASIMWQEGHSFTKCRHRIGPYALMQEHILQGLLLWPNYSLSSRQRAKDIVFVSRKPKLAVVMKRQVANEDDILGGLRAAVYSIQQSYYYLYLPQDMRVVYRNFAELPIRDQVKSCLHARVIVGPHGAGMTWGMFYQSLPGAGVVEIAPYIEGGKLWPKLFANAAVLIGVNYVRWDASYTETHGATTVHVPTIYGLTETILKLDPTKDLGPRQGGPGVLGLVRSGQPTEFGKMPKMQAGSERG